MPKLFYGLWYDVSFFKCLVLSYFGTIPKNANETAILRPLGCLSYMGLNWGALTLRYMENNIVALGIF